MPTSYPEWNYKGSDPVAQAADKLFRARAKPCRLSPFVFMTDPKRVPDPVTTAKVLPKGCAIIYRHFGAGDARKTAEDLRQVTFERGQQFLIGDDPNLAAIVGADGVHFKRDRRLTAPALWRQLCPDWIISMAGIKHGKYSGDLNVLDALLVSSVFESESESAGAAIGAEAFATRVTELEKFKPGVFALGGVNAKTAHELTGLGAAGLAGIGGLMPKLIVKGETMTAVTVTKESHGEEIQLVARVEGFDEKGVLDLKKSKPGVYAATHTGVPSVMGGKGVGSALVKALIEDARNEDYKIIPACSFVEAKFRQHKDWADRRAD